MAVIGAGQADLSAGYHLRRQGFVSALTEPGAKRNFVTFAAESRPGEAWLHRGSRRRWRQFQPRGRGARDHHEGHGRRPGGKSTGSVVSAFTSNRYRPSHSRVTRPAVRAQTIRSATNCACRSTSHGSSGSVGRASASLLNTTPPPAVIVKKRLRHGTGQMGSSS
ncbi:hypothetical protein E1202_29845 [Saccharopolyspora karakumensis]|uniref:Uncharacterized protein n=1 Tax=Saccharopolyspora karakumensis TaxID=2530386 RepID=A0A4R5B528_9PSEU|nr:hypothetical protein E1202_29845 [Saccharopolyspora karakumensis]